MRKTWFFAAAVIGWAILSSVSLGYSGGDGSAGNPYQIASKTELLAMAADTGNYDKCFILTADIDMGGQVFTTAVIALDTDNTVWGFQGIAFTGVFDGNGHKITNFTIDGLSNYYLGLFGSINSSGQVNNLGIENCAVSGYQCTGSLVGKNYGTITGCRTTGTIYGRSMDIGGLIGTNTGTIVSCYSAGTVNGDGTGVGGLVGTNYGGGITNSYSTSAVTGGGRGTGGLVGSTQNSVIDNCYATGTVNGNFVVGGLVGFNNVRSVIHASYSTGEVNCTYFDVGGLVAINSSDSSIVSSFWDIDTSEQTTSAGGTGKTTVQMQTGSTFINAGWDFMNTWAICQGTNYPRLRWQIPAGDWICPDGVNVEDLDYFVERWMLNNCTADNNYCGGGDVDSSGEVDLIDYAIFAEHWLEGV